MATRGTITIHNNTPSNSNKYDTRNYSCHSIVEQIYTTEFRDFLLQIEFTVGGTYRFSSSANGKTCYMYYGHGPMKTFGVVNNGRIDIATTSFRYVAGDVQAHPEWFSHISFGCGSASSNVANILPNGGNGKFHIIMNFNIPDWFVAGEPIAQPDSSAHKIVHRFIQLFYSGTMYVPFRIRANNAAAPFRQEICLDNQIKYPTIGTSGAVMSAADENTLLYSQYANRTFTS